MHDQLITALDRAVFEADAWSEVCDQIAKLVSGTGTMFVPVKVEQRVRGIPLSASLVEASEPYFSQGWNISDPRAACVPLMLSRGYVTDQDFLSPDTLVRHPHYAEFLASHNLKWFLGVAFKSNSDIWCAAVQGSPARGAFSAEDGQRLIAIRQHLSIAASRATGTGFDRTENWKAAFESAGRGILAVNGLCQVSAVSPAAEALLGGKLLLIGRQLTSHDPIVATRLEALIRAAVRYDPCNPVLLPPPVLIPSGIGPALSVEALPMPRDFQSVLTEAMALVVVREVNSSADSPGNLLRAIYKLTASEIRLALSLSQGAELALAAAELGITTATARTHLKSIFHKTDTHRQAELIALLARLSPPG